MQGEEAFMVLLNAKTKETVDDIFMSCYRYRHDSVPDRIKKVWLEELECSMEDINALIVSTTKLIRTCVLETMLPSQHLSSEFHNGLSKIFDRIIKARIQLWQQSSIDNQVSPAKLLDFDWRVDTKVASNNLNKMTASSLLLGLHIQSTPTQAGIMPETRTVQLELGPQELNTLLDGLMKIKEQLAAIQ